MYISDINVEIFIKLKLFRHVQFHISIYKFRVLLDFFVALIIRMTKTLNLFKHKIETLASIR